MSSRLLILAWSPNDVGRPRIGFVVSKRISKRAVERNHLKRLLGEAARAYLPGLLPGMDIVFSARNAANTATLQTLAVDYVYYYNGQSCTQPRPTHLPG
jgi:ribonuclease P protein component